MKIQLFARNKSSQGYGPAKYILIVVYLLLIFALFLPPIYFFAWGIAFFAFFRERDSTYLRLHCAQSGFVSLIFSIVSIILRTIGDVIIAKAQKAQNEKALIQAMLLDERFMQVIQALRWFVVAYIIIQLVLGFTYRYLRLPFVGSMAERLEKNTRPKI